MKKTNAYLAQESYSDERVKVTGKPVFRMGRQSQIVTLTPHPWNVHWSSLCYVYGRGYCFRVVITFTQN